MTKGLEALNDLWYGKKTTETYQAVEKELKALEVIKKIIKYDVEVNHNCDIPKYEQNEVISKEGYDLLKEVLL